MKLTIENPVSMKTKRSDLIMSEGIVWKYGDDIDTDQIIASQYLLDSDIYEMKKHTFESIDSSFAERVKKGDFIVAGKNFGCGSSREQAPIVLKKLGIECIIAESFARIFFRNSINIGLPVFIIEDLYSHVETGDHLEIFLSDGFLKHKGNKYLLNSYPEYIYKIIKNGGMINFVNNTGGEI